ncbi:bifunctional hydroxymethylpyrimidine kinase/phosphomethylpyrimidine kinase [Acetobacter sp. AN02]|uniref:bifunctional hydroxymethylpyrimidine kinase/phosphomethylpyrimidine kinase n=1 Tax=Acetobacter sp. AN02 TaxID=2894186 RepID=UPI0024344122|nr:bifunctional hydroxymethylpyrimidine kinase/phosphomethylpyrimidine kinase [Acetobacter sp. AN02]MDG6093683.1 bifunctional hydroxymethylpyrimidine kinase/phosphomethylpyrimidine kinase [Acetobacter sp. AN02]
MIPNILSIAGTDPSGGAGIQADLKVFSALGVYGMSVITCVVAQNTCGVRGSVVLEPDFVRDQLDAVFEDVRVDAVKIGMVATAGIVEAIASCLDRYRPGNVVFDPVMVAKSGDALMAPDAVEAVKALLLPRCDVVTPNLPEAEVLLGRRPAWSAGVMRQEALALLETGARRVLLKGGHLGGSDVSTDVLCGPEGILELTAPRIESGNDHGTGCTLSAAIAAFLPRYGVTDSVRLAKAYLSEALAASDYLDVGRGHGPLHHSCRLRVCPETFISG